MSEVVLRGSHAQKAIPIRAFLIFVFFLPLVSAFAVTQIISPPMLVAIIVALLAMPTLSLVRLDSADFFLLALLNVSGISELLIVVQIGDSSLLHFFSLLFVVFFYYLVPKKLISILTTQQQIKMAWVLLSSAFLSIIFLALEFWAANFGGWQIPVPRPAVTEYNPTALGFIYRARSFAEESGHFAFFVVTAIPIAMGLLEGKRSLALSACCGAAIAITLLLTFSVAALIAVIFGLLLGSMVSRSGSRALVAAIASGVLIIAWTAVPEDLNYVLQHLSSGSVLDRQARAAESLAVWAQSPIPNLFFGLGPGYYRPYGVESVIGLYALFLAQYGVLGLFSFAGFLLCSLIAVAKIPDRSRRYWFAIALGSVVVMFASVSNYWFPWPWLCFATLLVHGSRCPARSFAPV